MDPTPLDWIPLRNNEITVLLTGHGFTKPRVIGWASAGLDLPEPADSGRKATGRRPDQQ